MSIKNCYKICHPQYRVRKIGNKTCTESPEPFTLGPGAAAAAEKLNPKDMPVHVLMLSWFKLTTSYLLFLESRFSILKILPLILDLKIIWVYSPLIYIPWVDRNKFWLTYFILILEKCFQQHLIQFWQYMYETTNHLFYFWHLNLKSIFISVEIFICSIHL